MCGLAGIISTEPTTFNVNEFNILGILNDERGGDSCGIFIDGMVKYGIKDSKLFRNFSPTIKYPSTAKIALLHCRKASAGYIVNEAQAQPVIIREDNEIKFVLMHNGTILNIKELAKKYIPDESINNLSDSQVLAKIIYIHGYEVLKEYTGYAVLIIVDYRTSDPKILMFKGSSGYNEAKSNSERPLYYMIKNNRFYFSSMACSLYAIDNNSTIYEFPTNVLTQLDGVKLIKLKDIDRTKIVNKLFDTTTYYHNYNTYSNTYGQYLLYDFNTNLYKVNGNPANGIYNVYPSGYIAGTSETSSSSPYCSTLAFYEGRLLYNKECLNFLREISELFEDNFIKESVPEIIDYFSYTPLIVNNKVIEIGENFQFKRKKEGHFVVLFNTSYRINVFKNSFSKLPIYPTIAIDEYKSDTENVHFDFDTLENEIYKYISNKIVNNDI